VELAAQRREPTPFGARSQPKATRPGRQRGQSQLKRGFRLLTIEGEKDDISGVGQTYAANELCVNIPEWKRLHHMQLEAGHYGVFNGSRFRKQIVPFIRRFIAIVDERPAKPTKPNAAGKAVAEGASAEDVGPPPPILVPPAGAQLTALS